MAIPAGEYEVKIKLTDDNAKGQEESEWTLSIKVFGISTKYTNVDKVEEDFSGYKDYPVPKIKSITTLGELSLTWSKEMETPTNETLFNE